MNRHNDQEWSTSGFFSEPLSVSILLDRQKQKLSKSMKKSASEFGIRMDFEFEGPADAAAADRRRRPMSAEIHIMFACSLYNLRESTKKDIRDKQFKDIKVIH